MKGTALACVLFLLTCSAAVGQTPDTEGTAPASPDIRQVAYITLIGERGVVVERQEGDETKRITLAGPHVSIVGPPGTAFAVDDLNSPTVGGLLGEGATVTYVGDFELTYEPQDSDTPQLEDSRVLVYDALVEIKTEEVTERQAQSRAGTADQYEVPLNQRGEYIRAMRDKVKSAQLPGRN